ncbi:MAG TPA: hypothetical protein VGP43_08425 [Chitinophagaceae bacterium]|nr:hypothetical protein [Chitinophagaceae bacterium]
MDKLILKAVLFFAKLLVKQGIDFEKLKTIVETKLLIDRRRVYMNWRPRQQKENSNPLLITLLIYTVFGLFVGVMVFKIESFVICMALIHSYILFMMALTMITDFSSVLLDTTDNQIILSKPVNSRILFIARLVHILVYLLQFAIAFSLLPVIFIFIAFGFTIGMASIGTALLTVMFAVFLTYLLYAVILRFSNEQKVKDIVGYFQIFVTIFFAAGFQIMPRLVNFNSLLSIFELHWYSYFLPPVWMALTLESVNQLNFDTIHLLMIACAILLPLLTFWVMIKYLAPSFSKKLAALDNVESKKKDLFRKNANHINLSQKLSNLLCNSKIENSSFGMVWKITGRDKAFKMQLYPSLAYMGVFVFVFVFKNGQDFNHLWQNLPTTKMFLFFAYLPIFTIGSSIGFMSFHENFLASWIYQSTPINQPGQLLTGGIKALLTKFFIPIFLTLFLFVFYVWGFAIVNDFVLAFFNNIFIFFLIANLGNKYLPFSREQNSKEQSGRILYLILQMLTIAILVGLHYLIVENNLLIYCLIPVSAVGCYLLLKRLQNLQWAQISF